MYLSLITVQIYARVRRSSARIIPLVYYSLCLFDFQEKTGILFSLLAGLPQVCYTCDVIYVRLLGTKSFIYSIIVNISFLIAMNRKGLSNM